MTNQRPQVGASGNRTSLLIATFLVILTAVAVSGITFFLWKRGDEAASPRAEWRTPSQTLFSVSIRVEPVPGWRTKITDIGLPDARTEPPYKFGNDADPSKSNPYVGNIGDRAYYVVGNAGGPLAHWWLVSIDARTGRSLFAPVSLEISQVPPRCYLNGPDALLCLTDATEQTTAWVLDADSGTRIFTGPTDLSTRPGELGVIQVGLYAVAQSQSKGVYGIGPRAETTWFVPGRGEVQQRYNATDFAPLMLATQITGGTPDRQVTFSLQDGAVIKPDIDGRLQQQMTVIYPGGFAAVIAGTDSEPAVQFFDEAGKRVGPGGVAGSFNSDLMDIPVIALDSGGWTAYTAQGVELVGDARPNRFAARVIGDSLYVRDTPSWRQYDLRTGTAGKECTYPLKEGYIGSDGKVALTEKGTARAGFRTTAFDLASCDSLWTVNSPADSFHKLWRINTTLVQISDDGTELMSLVAPG